jgi:hypothetical protein
MSSVGKVRLLHAHLFAIMMSHNQFYQTQSIKELISSLKTKDAGAEALCESFVPLIKRHKANQMGELLEVK